mmetsp:Transcript_38437/g.89339  ORF Transcript_38437/g.89339 Transcript_38437/m.89339 type:complete len:235 (-) Transcript_38437:476-1180(-)
MYTIKSITSSSSSPSPSSPSRSSPTSPSYPSLPLSPPRMFRSRRARRTAASLRSISSAISMRTYSRPRQTLPATESPIPSTTRRPSSVSAFSPSALTMRPAVTMTMPASWVLESTRPSSTLANNAAQIETEEKTMPNIADPLRVRPTVSPTVPSQSHTDATTRGPLRQRGSQRGKSRGAPLALPGDGGRRPKRIVSAPSAQRHATSRPGRRAPNIEMYHVRLGSSASGYRAAPA